MDDHRVDQLRRLDAMMSRRDLIWLGLAAAVAGVAGFDGIDRADGRPLPRTAIGPARELTSTATTAKPPAWARPWSVPVSSLNQFVHRCPKAHMPYRAVLLTIDDGPSPEWTPKYLRLLARHDIRATFCMIGERVHANRKLVKSVVAHGHHIANHSWSHDESLASRSTKTIRREIVDANDAIVRASGFVPAQFRAPGGGWGPRMLTEISRHRMLPLGWNIDPRDWARPGTGAIESAMLAAGRHDIILCHDGGGDRSETYAALEYVLPRLKKRGLRFEVLPS